MRLLEGQTATFVIANVAGPIYQAMTIILNHAVAPARNKQDAARWFAQIFGLRFEGAENHFAPVHVNETFTLLFTDEASFGLQHYAFHVGDAEFDAILGRVKDSSSVQLLEALPGAARTASSTIGMAAVGSISRAPTAIFSN